MRIQYPAQEIFKHKLLRGDRKDKVDRRVIMAVKNGINVGLAEVMKGKLLTKNRGKSDISIASVFALNRKMYRFYSLLL